MVRANSRLQKCECYEIKHRDSSVVPHWATGWMVWGSSTGRSWEFFSSPPLPDRIWGPPSLLSKWYQGLFPWGLSGRGVKLTTHLHPVPRSRMRGAIPPLPNTSSWRHVSLSTGTTLPLPGYEIRNRHSSMVQRWAMGWMIGNSSPGKGWEFFFSPPHQDRLWGPPSYLSNGYQGLATHLHLVPRSRMRGTIPPLPQYAFMERSSVKSTGTTSPFTFYLYPVIAQSVYTFLSILCTKRTKQMLRADRVCLLTKLCIKFKAALHVRNKIHYF
jgi:hypothetical protein